MSQALHNGNPFRAVVRDILRDNDVESVDDMELGDSVRIESDVYHNLSIEKHSNTTLLVMQTYKQHGDLMRDPSVLLDVSDDTWTVVEFRQDGVGVNQYDSDGLNLGGFLGTWSNNLRSQGFVES